MRADADGLYRLSLDLPGARSEIVIGAGALGAAHGLADWVRGRTLFLLSSRPVWDLHGAALDDLRQHAAKSVELDVADGEAAKTVATADWLWQAMLEAGGKRDSRLITLGGGTVGDLGGFVAGCFLRGIPFAQVPTTLLAQVDAAIGGKTGVDLPQGKNTVGVFHHPAWVIADTALLGTLSRDELRAGLVEVVKMAFLLDVALLERVERDLDALLAGDAAKLAPVVAAAAAAKLGVVADDPTEGDRRRLLNFGHTLGHAIEASLGYQGLRHGDAVGYGLLFALRLACRRGLEGREAARLQTLLQRFELPPLPALEVEDLLAHMSRDKKATEGGLVWVLPQRLGQGYMTRDVTPDEVREELASFLTEPLAPPAAG